MEVEDEINLFQVTNVRNLIVGNLKDHVELHEALLLGKFYLLNTLEQQEVLKHIKFDCYSL